MNRRVLKMFATWAALLCLAPATAWAGFESKDFDCWLNGVNKYGCLSPNVKGDCTTFVALENTCYGWLTGTAKGCVENDSGCGHLYLNNSNFGTIYCSDSYCSGPEICVTSSQYTVYPPCNGFSLVTLTATGIDKCDNLQ